MEKIKEKENDVLSMILKSDELFKSFASTQDELSAFLSLEKERRDNVSLSLVLAIKAEASRQNSALERLFKLSSRFDFPAFYFSILSEELKKEEQLRNMIAQEILEGYFKEKSRRKRASVSFNALLEARLRRMGLEMDLGSRIYLNKLEFPKIYKPRISR